MLNLSEQWLDQKFQSVSVRSSMARLITQVLGTQLQAGNFEECLERVITLAPVWKQLISHNAKKNQLDPALLTMMIQSSDALDSWALSNRENRYENIYSALFVSLWASFEAGIENILAAILECHQETDGLVINKLRTGQTYVDSRPWSSETCLQIVQKLEGNARNSLGKNSGHDLCLRFRTLLSWFDIKIDMTDEVANKLNEAAMVRNQIMHRAGRIEERNAVLFPAFEPYVGQIFPLSRAQFEEYANSIRDYSIALAHGIANCPYR